MTRKLFGTDGIRGPANTFPMTADMALKVAMAAAHVLRARAGRQGTDRAIIGKDTRLSGYMFEEAMCAGFVAMGMDVMMVGPIPTPGIAMLTRSLRADLGVMISASHNPFQDNGIKLFGADGFKLPDATEQAIERALEDDLSAHLALPADIGKATRIEDALGRYGEFIKNSFPRGQSLEGLKIVVDCAQGAAYKIAPQLLWELEAHVSAIGVQPNGRNINDGCGATSLQALSREVVERGADIGVALDGDADRLIVVDEKGHVIDGDQLMAALALSMKAQGALRHDTLVATVMSNLGMEKFLQERGVTLHRTAVGDRYVVEAMRAGGFSLGGEQSGHIIMTDYGTTGDGLLAALQVLALVKAAGKPASQTLKLFEPMPQVLKNVRFAAGRPLENPAVLAAIEKAQKTLAQDGRILVRPSGTEPVIRVMAEGRDARAIEKLAGELCDAIENAAACA